MIRNRIHIFIAGLIISNVLVTPLWSSKTQREVANETCTIGIYMAAANDLFPFAGRNIKQMQNVGSTEKIKICIHFDMQRPGQKKTTKRLLIEKNKIIQIGQDMAMDSGERDTLIDFGKWMVEKFPSDNYILVLWNHGTGIIEPVLKKSINPAELFNYNPVERIIELNRNIGFLDYLNSPTIIKEKQLGICFDDATGNYLSNQKLKEALHAITRDYMGGKKFAILACDACLMSMIEVMSPLKDYVDYFVGSEELELGTGYNYADVLTPLLDGFSQPKAFAQHIVETFEKTYGKITHDYTHSAVDLKYIGELDQAINELAITLMNGLQYQKNKSVKDVIKLSRHKNFCVYFDETTYIDFGHFCQNLVKNAQKCNLSTPEESTAFRLRLSKSAQACLEIMQKAVIANVCGKNLKSAMGISIYFPEYHIYKSYNESEFATKTTKWLEFIRTYIRN